MNWKLIFGLSLFGLAMALATVYFIPSKAEPIYWLLIFLICAYLIARYARGRYFLHGLCVSLVNSVWIAGVHFLLFDTYAATHKSAINMMEQSNVPHSPRLFMLMTAPVIGLLSGLVLGLLAFLASRIMKMTFTQKIVR